MFPPATPSSMPVASAEAGIAPPRRQLQRLMRALASRRVQAISLLILALVFVLFRWAQRREPLNSDDMIVFDFSTEAAQGRHWLFEPPPAAADAKGANRANIPHHAFRVGLLPIAVPAIGLLGPNAAVYYLTPLVFALAGFCALCWITLEHFGPLPALLFGAIHVIWPFELEHSSLFLTDLPAAAMGVVSLCLLDASARPGARGRIGFAVLAGLAAWETYLLRNNGLVLLGPAFLVFLWSRQTRVQTLVAVGVALLGVFAQQAALAYRGFGWGYDWLSVRKDFAEYAPFLPVYSWGGFLVRQLTYQLTTFGRGVTGMLAALLVLGSLAAHLVVLRKERRPLLRSLAAFGLFSWLVFSFSIYERVPGGVRATVPVNFRFVQPFTYSSIVVWAWVWCWLQSALAARSENERARFRLHPRIAAALPLVLVTFSLLALVVRAPETYARGATRRLAEALQAQISAMAGPRIIAGTQVSLRMPRVFAPGGASQPVEWRELPADELDDVAERRGGEMVLRDVPRELTLARYMDAEARHKYRDELARAEEILWHDYTLAHVDAKYALFTPSTSTALAAVSAAGSWIVPSTPPSEAELLSTAPCRTSSEEPEGWRTLIPARGSGSRARCEKTWPGDGRAPPTNATTDASGFVLRLHADYEAPLGLMVDVVQHLESEVLRRRALLPPGTSYVPVRPAPGARSVSLVYRVMTRGAPEGQTVRIRPAEWRPHRFSDGDGEMAPDSGDSAS